MKNKQIKGLQPNHQTINRKEHSSIWKKVLGLLGLGGIVAGFIYVKYQQISTEHNLSRASEDGKIRLSDDLIDLLAPHKRKLLISSFSQALKQLKEEKNPDIEIFSNFRLPHVYLSSSSLNLPLIAINRQIKQQVEFGILPDNAEESNTIKGYEHLNDLFLGDKKRYLSHEIHHLVDGITSSDLYCMQTPEWEQQKFRKLGFEKYGMTTAPRNSEQLLKASEEENAVIINKLGKLLHKRNQHKLTNEEQGLLQNIESKLTDYKAPYYSLVLDLNNPQQKSTYEKIKAGINLNKPVLAHKPTNNEALYIYSFSRYHDKCVALGYQIEDPTDILSALVAETKDVASAKIENYEQAYGQKIGKTIYAAELGTMASEQGQKAISMFHPKSKAIYKKNRAESACKFVSRVDKEVDISEEEMASYYQRLLKIN